MDETELCLKRWNGGDAAAGAELAMADADWICGRIRRARGGKLGRDVETVDQLQDLLVDVLAYRPRFAVRSRKQFRGLIARMLTNDLADKARRASARPQRATLAQLSESRVSLVVDGSFTAPDAAAERSEDVAWLRLGVDFLDDESRELILRHVFEGETFVSIAETTAVSADAVRMRYHRVMVRLGGIVQRLQRGEADELMDETGDESDSGQALA